MSKPQDSLIDVIVTPRFEVFYALQALESTAAEHLQSWRREMQRRLTPSARSALTRIAPSPLIWPLLADALRDIQPAPGFIEMMAELRGMEDSAFQQAVLAGVFKLPGSVDRLLAKDMDLAATISAEAISQERLLSLLGLLPFSARNPSVLAFTRLVNDPAGYKHDVVNQIVSFWGAGFAETWRTLEPHMRDRARALRQSATIDGASDFSRNAGLPIVVAADHVRSVRGTMQVGRKSVSGIHVIPSAFNIAGLWAAYPGSEGDTRFFIPLLDATLSPDTRMSIEPEVVFNALGDTTRYAIASTIARKPMTSVELARVFEVSKPTISHHVQVLRTAGLLEETHTESGTLLALNRRVLERTSGAAVREMFSGEKIEDALSTVRRTRIPNRK